MTAIEQLQHQEAEAEREYLSAKKAYEAVRGLRLETELEVAKNDAATRGLVEGADVRVTIPWRGSHGIHTFSHVVRNYSYFQAVLLVKKKDGTTGKRRLTVSLDKVTLA